jgi:hypothetical protein
MKNLLLLVCTFTFFNLFSQNETDKKYILKTSIGYYYQHLDKNDAGKDYFGHHYYGEINSNFNTGLSIYKSRKSGIFYGFGILFNNSKEIINPESDTPKSASGFGSYVSYNTNNKNTNTISPFVSFGYNKYLSNKLSISVELYSKYDFVYLKQKSSYYVPDHIGNFYDSHIVWVESSSSTTKYKNHFIQFGLLPSVRYDFTKTIGLELAFGNIHYKKKTKDTKDNNTETKSSEFKADFTPANWFLSFYLRL